MKVGTSRRIETSEASAMEPTMEAGVGPATGCRPALGPVVQIDEGCIQEHLDEGGPSNDRGDVERAAQGRGGPAVRGAEV